MKNIFSQKGVEINMETIGLSDRLSTLNDAFGNRLNGEIGNEDISKMVTAILETLNLEGKENKNFSTAVIENKKEDFFGIRVFPDAESLDAITKKLVTDHSDRGEFELQWKSTPSWIVEIDSRCFDDMRISFVPEELTAFLLFEVINVVYTTDCPSIIYDSYVNSYMHQSYFGRRGMEILYLLYEVAVLNACFSKNWIVAQDDPAKAVESAYEVEVLNEYKQNIISGISKVIRNYGNNMIMDDMEKFRVVDSLITWANRFALDYTKRRNELKDDILWRASVTSSIYLRANYIRILHSIGIELRERFTGAAIESGIQPEIFDDPEFMKSYLFSFAPISKKAAAIENQILQIPSHVKMALEAVFHRNGVKLPSERDVDMIFIDIDRMENQFDRKYVLDRIYRLMDRIVTFEDFYQDDEDVMSNMRPTIDRLRKSLEEARTRVLSIRSFEKNYKVFVRVPKGYEG